MLLEVFVRASGAAMGLARDSFGVDGGAGVVSSSGPSPALAAEFFGSGQAAWAFDNESNVVGGIVSALGEQDLAAESGLVSALTAAGAGRGQMDSVIAAALADVNGLAAASTTPAGQQALVNALAARLEQTWQALTDGNADASMRAASSGQVAAAYSGLGSYPAGGVAAGAPMAYAGAMPYTGAAQPMGSMSAMQSMPMMAAGTMAANQAASSAAQAANTQSASEGDVKHATLTSGVTPTGPNKPHPVPIPVNTVLKNINNTISVSKPSQAAFIHYANQALAKLGITGSAAHLWLYGTTGAAGGFARTSSNPDGLGGLLLGAQRESSWNALAVNTWDSNATGPKQVHTDGAPQNCSRGLMQTIPSTFAQYHQLGTSYNIYNPVANIAAALNYLINRYHVELSGKNLQDVSQFDPASSGGGY